MFHYNLYCTRSRYKLLIFRFFFPSFVLPERSYEVYDRKVTAKVLQYCGVSEKRCKKRGKYCRMTFKLPFSIWYNGTQNDSGRNETAFLVRSQKR